MRKILLLPLFALLGFLALFLAPPAAQAQPVLTANKGTTNHTGGTSYTFNVTATSGNYVVVMAMAAQSGTGTMTVSISGCVTWTTLSRVSTQLTGGSTYTGYILATGKATSNLSGCTVTISTSAGMDDASAVWGEFSGVDATTPADSNASLPAVATSVSNTQTTSAAFATSQAHDVILLGVNGGATSNASGCAASGYSSVGSISNAGGSLFSSVCLLYKAVTTAQGSASVSLTSGKGPNVVVHAITADSAIVPSLTPFFHFSPR